MPTVLVTTRELTQLNASGAPSSQAIAQAFAGVNLGTWGQWVGPAPRIVRHMLGALEAPAGQPVGLYTFAAMPFSMPDNAFTRDHAQYILNQLVQGLDARLATTSNAWSLAAVNVFNPVNNGPLTWWSSGAAANTQTKDVQTDALLNLTITNREAPFGPGPSTDPAAPRDVAEQAIQEGLNQGQQLLNRAARGVAPVLAAAGVVLVLLSTRK